ncbi:MAG TPA: hypothetical protein PLB63_01205 [Planctomycetota bacterium]|nr:hypothetical protein [Planctomycetota bacterium]HQB01184.1 hypothetical protein [Planctomycetota bacterium]
MKKFLDDAFCEHLLNKKLIDKALLAQVKAENKYVTTRESLLLQEHIKFNTYQNILVSLRNDKELVDTEQSTDFDRRFIEYGIRQDYLSQEDVEISQKHALTSAFTTRELLMVTSTIDMETYRQIMNALGRQYKAKVEDPDKTIVEEEAEPKDKLTESQLSIVCDNSAETIIDISMDMDEPNPTNFRSSKFEDDDDSIETIIDGNMDIYNFADDDVPAIAREETIVEVAKTRTPKTSSLPSTASASYTSSAHEYSTGSSSKRDLRLQQTIEVPDTRVASISDTMIRPKPQPQAPYVQPQPQAPYVQPQPQAPYAQPQAPYVQPQAPYVQPQPQAPYAQPQPQPPVAYAVPSIDDLVLEVQKQVNLQTQQMSQSMVREIDTYRGIYKNIVAVIVFLFLFILAFTGWIEFQRLQELQETKAELKTLQNDKATISLNMQSYEQAKINAQEELEKIKSQQRDIEEKEQKFEQRETQWKNERKKLQSQINTWQEVQQKLEQARVHAYKKDRKKVYEIGDEIKNISDDQNDVFILYLLGNFYMEVGFFSRAEVTFRSIVKTNPESWQAYLQLYRLYEKNSKAKNKSQDALKKAISLNPALKK